MRGVRSFAAAPVGAVAAASKLDAEIGRRLLQNRARRRLGRDVERAAAHRAVCSHETSSPAVSSRLIAMKLSFALWLK